MTAQENLRWLQRLSTDGLESDALTEAINELMVNSPIYDDMMTCLPEPVSSITNGSLDEDSSNDLPF